MRYPLLLTTVLAIIFGCSEPAVKPAEEPAMKLVWSDEFDYTGLPDSTRWAYDTGGHGWGNNELQFYTKSRAENARVENGFLVIEAKRESMEKSEYTSARLITKGKAEWQYGRVEVRAKLPRGRGTWPAIWMLAGKEPFAWPDDGEIDIMEHVGYAHGRVHGTVHTKKYNHVAGTQRGDTIRANDLSENFHTYSVEWDIDSLRISMDSVTYFTFKNERPGGYDAWPFDNAFYLLLNVAVGGNWGGQQGVDTTIWPQSMEIDYVRVFQKPKQIAAAAR